MTKTEFAPTPTPLTTDEAARAVAAYEAGASIRAVAAELGRSYGAVWRVLDRACVEMRPRGRRKAAA